MTIYMRIEDSYDPRDTWDDDAVLWNSTSVTWNSTQTNSETEIEEAVLTKSIGDNNSSTRLEITLNNPNGLHTNDWNEGTTVTLYADKDVTPPTTKLFSGMVVEKRFSSRGGRTPTIKVTARDWTSLLQRTTVEPEVYTNQQISAIVTDLIQKYAPSTFTTNNVSTVTKTLDRISFKQITLFDAIKKLAELAGDYFFYVDEDKDVHFTAKGTTSSGVTLNNTNVLSSNFTTDVESVKNKVYVYGNRMLVAHPRETFTADGVGSVFTLDANPHNTKVTVANSEKKGNIFQGTETTTSGADYLVNFHDKKIIFVSGTNIGYSSIPGSLSAVAVDYQVSRPIIKLAIDQASIDAYGQRTEIVVDESIEDPAFATELAKNRVALQKDPKTQGMIDVRGVIDLPPGYTVVVNLPNDGQSSKTYDILETKYVFNADTMRKEKVVTVKVSHRISNITDILKELIQSVNRLQAAQIDDSAVITRLLVGAGSMGIKGPSWNVKTVAIQTSYVVGHAHNGVIGSPASAQGGGQVVIGNQRAAGVIQVSGGE